MSAEQKKFAPLIQRMISADWLKRPTLQEIDKILTQIAETL